MKDAGMLRSAHRWSLDFFMENVPTGHDASLFSVYRAAEPQRRFRYANGSSEGDVQYSLESEESAERLLLDFHEFARRKRAAAGQALERAHCWHVVD